MKKISNFCIMIIGTNSSGKTSLARNIHSNLREHFGKSKDDFEIVEWDGVNEKGEKKKCSFTKMTSYSGNIGKMGHNRPTGGADNVSSRYQTKESLEKLMDEKFIATLEPIMATGPMVADVIDLVEEKNGKFLLILLDLNEEANLDRLRNRRAAKLGVDPKEIAITDKTISNISSKRKFFPNLFNRFKDEADFSIELDTSNLTQEKVAKKVNKKILKILKGL